MSSALARGTNSERWNWKATSEPQYFYNIRLHVDLFEPQFTHLLIGIIRPVFSLIPVRPIIVTSEFCNYSSFVLNPKRGLLSRGVSHQTFPPHTLAVPARHGENSIPNTFSMNLTRVLNALILEIAPYVSVSWWYFLMAMLHQLSPSLELHAWSGSHSFPPFQKY